MTNILCKRGLVLVIIVLFVGAGIFPSISGNINRFNDKLDSMEHVADTIDDWSMDAQSTTGPIPPFSCDMGLNSSSLSGQIIIAGVPTYLWRHGCGPTAAGMVIGYWDGHGYDDLIQGDASTQTNAVNQAIASGGDSSNPNPPGSEQHYEDYARPEDSYPNLIIDDYITQGRTPHPSDCIADYMKTSRSTENNYYGWSWFSQIDDSLLGYINWANPEYDVLANNLQWGELTWENFCREIDANRPVILLVDTDGNGNTDHFITAIGYDDSQNYACYNTWDTNVHWFDFSEMASGNPWGIYGATFCAISKGTFYFGLIWGNYTSKARSGLSIIADCNQDDLKVFGFGKRINGDLMVFEKNFTKIAIDVFLGFGISGYMFGGVISGKIY